MVTKQIIQEKLEGLTHEYFSVKIAISFGRGY
jgi:hypothetical protein